MKQFVNVKCCRCGKVFHIGVKVGDLQAWRNGKLIQEVMSYLSPGERELLISGVCGDCFDEAFGRPSEDL